MNRHDIPPNYFYAGLALTIALRYLFPQFNIIGDPVNFLGLIVIAAGCVLTYVFWKEFIDSGTSESYRDETSCIVSGGVYAHSRNPMYIGMIIVLLGAWVTMMMNILSLSGTLLFFVILHLKFIPYEEKRMAEQFGDEFEDYAARVPRWI